MRAGVAFLAALGAAHATVAYSREALSSEAAGAYTAGRHDRYQTLLIDQARACDAKAPASSDDCLDLDLLVAQALNSYSYFGSRPGPPNSYGLATTVDAPQDKAAAERLAAKGLAMVRARYLDAEPPLMEDDRVPLDEKGTAAEAEAIATLGFALTALGVSGLGDSGNWVRLALVEHLYRSGQVRRAAGVFPIGAIEYAIRNKDPLAWRMAAALDALAAGAGNHAIPPPPLSALDHAVLRVGDAKMALGGGHFAEAEGMVRSALPALSSAGPLRSSALALALIVLAHAVFEQARESEAFTILDQADGLLGAVNQGSVGEQVALARAALLDSLDRPKESIPIYEELLAARRTRGVFDGNGLSPVLAARLRVYAPFEPKGLSFAERVPIPKGPEAPAPMVKGALALALASAGRHDEAYREARESLSFESDPKALLAILQLAAIGKLPAEAFPRGEDVLALLRDRLGPADVERIDALVMGTLMRLSGGDNPALRGNPYALNPIGARQLLKEAEAVVQARVSGMGAWGSSGERELRKYAPLYRLDVRLAWAMSPSSAR